MTKQSIQDGQYEGEVFKKERDTNAEDKGGMSVSSVKRQHKERRFVLQELVSDAARRLTTASQFEGSYSITLVRIFTMHVIPHPKFTEMKGIVNKY